MKPIFYLKDQHGDRNEAMMPRREWKLPKGNHDEEEVDEHWEDDGNCPKGVSGHKELPG